MITGRPTKFKSEYCQKLYDWFNKEPFQNVIVTDPESGERFPLQDKFGNPIREPIKLPTKENFATSIKVHRDTIWEWANGVNKDEYKGIVKEFDEENEVTFSDVLSHVEQMQYDILMQNGLFGNYEKTYAKLVTVNLTDMRDKQDINQTVTETPSINVDIPKK